LAVQKTIIIQRSYLNLKRGELMEKGYCVKCKAKREMKDTKEVTMKNGRRAMKGKCANCGTGMYKILPKK